MDRPAIWGGLSIGPAPRCAPGLRCERVGAGPVTMPAALGMCSYAKARVTAGAGLPSIRPFAPLSQCAGRVARVTALRECALLSPPPHVRAHAVQEGDANSTLLPAPRPSQADGPETAVRRRTRIGLGGTPQRRRPCVCPAGRRRVFEEGEEGGRGHDSGGRAAGRPRSAASRTPYFSSPSSFPIQKQAGDGRCLRKALPLGAVRCGH